MVPSRGRGVGPADSTEEAPEGNEGVEGRGRPEGNLLEKAKIRTQSRVALLLNLRWVNGAARSMNRAVLGYLREEPYAGKPHVRFCEGEAEWLSYSTTHSPRLRRFQPTEVLDLPARNMAYLL